MKRTSLVTLGPDTYAITLCDGVVLSCTVYVGESEFPHDIDFDKLPKTTQQQLLLYANRHNN
jgi:hypothetical protein